jgi:uncharacterized membrane protein YdjX (TVP38/TMEM64 family)
MDAKAWRTLAISFVLFGGLGLVFIFGASVLGLKGVNAVQGWISLGAHGPFALPICIIAFTALAFLGVPQFVLVAAAVVAFGPWLGFAYSWVGNLVSSILGFYVGRRVGARVLRDYAGVGVNAFVEMIGRNGFWASLLVRLAPTAPFIVVNMAAGVTPMRAFDFIAGTALGSVPKIALTAFAGASMLHAMNGGTGGAGRWISLGLAAAAWILMALAARAWFRRQGLGATLPAVSGLTAAAPPQP